jgi:hypothetical protein
LPDALSVLARALPVLRAENVTAKVAASLTMLAELNEGWLGPSQIGKLLTVYPVDDEQAVALAALLDGVTHGFRGPLVPSDRPLRPGSLVHYRYGAFIDRPVRTPLGELVSAIVTPDGALVPDPRDTVYRQPDWVEDPFRATGVASAAPPRKLLVAERYLTVTTLHRSARGAVYLGIDLNEGRRCVLKRAAPNATARWDGQDAHELLRHEHSVLQRLRGSGAFPVPLELLADGDELYLAMEDVPGQALTEAARDLPAERRAQHVCRWGADLARALDLMHQQGYVHGDMKPANVVVTATGARVVDFDLAFEVGGTRAGSGAGSLGYQSPQRSLRAVPTPSDDVWALGATLTAALTGLPLGLLGDQFRVADLPEAVFPPRTSELLRATLARCLSPEPVDRWSSMRDLAEALDRVSEVSDTAVGRNRPAPATVPEVTEPLARVRSATRARATADGLVAMGLRRDDDDAPRSLPPGAMAWRSLFVQSQHGVCADLNAGAAGAVLALAEAVDTFHDPAHVKALRSASTFLLNPPRPTGYVAPGLWVGEAGRGAALLRAGQVLDEEPLIAAATNVACAVAALPHQSPDFYNGSAGRLLFHVLLWDETHDGEQLNAALEAARAIEARAVKDARGVRWAFPDGFDELSGDSRTLGYAHGVAGIADSLLDIAEVTGDSRWLNLAAEAVRTLDAEAIRLDNLTDATIDAGCLAWPRISGGAPNRPAWCHGAVGIGRFLLRASRAGIPDAARLARGAASSAGGADAALAGQCHGAAGVIEFLLDAYQAEGAPAHLDAARRMESAVDVFSFKEGEALHWVGEMPSRGSFEYAVGSSGLIPCLLRLADPRRRPHQMSRAGFRWSEARHGPSPVDDGAAVGTFAKAVRGQ